jgi:N,N-dimethylformamidase beta subunit-like protein
VPKGRIRRAPVASACVLAVVLAGCNSTASPASFSPAAGRPTASPAPTSSPVPIPPSQVASDAPIPSAQPSIVDENLKAGSTDWRMGGAGYQVGTDIGAEIKGYASDASVNVGQPITLFVSVSPAQQLKVDIYRLGWYGGAGGRLMVGGSWLPGVTQDPCPVEAGLRTCNWQPTVQFTVPSTWVSGVYLAILTNERHFQNAVHFVVRDDASTSPLLYVQPETTYQAYNPWPHDGSGRSLYATTRISFDRPYADDGIARSFLDFEQPFVAWLERAGYQVSYATSIDLHEQGAALLRRHRVMVTSGHDEYWTAQMRVAATSALANGTSLAFFSANNIYWQVRLEAAPDGRPDRVLVCYRTETLDPDPTPVLKTVRWRDAPVSLPELNLLGAEYTNSVAGRAAWVVAGSDSWVYRGTGLSDGQSIPDLVSGESDRPRSPTPDSAPKATVLSDSPFQNRYGRSDRSQAVLYQAPSGAWVFNASTFGWAAAINPFGQPDLRVERMSANLLDRMGSATVRRSGGAMGFATRIEP